MSRVIPLSFLSVMFGCWGSRQGNGRAMPNLNFANGLARRLVVEVGEASPFASGETQTLNARASAKCWCDRPLRLARLLPTSLASGERRREVGDGEDRE